MPQGKNDYNIKVGISTQDAEKKIGQIAKQITALAKSTAAINKTLNAQQQSKIQGQAKEVKQARDINAEKRKQLQYEKAIEQRATLSETMKRSQMSFFGRVGRSEGFKTSSPEIAGELNAIEATYQSIQQKLKNAHDPKVVKQLRGEFNKLKTSVSEVNQKLTTYNQKLSLSRQASSAFSRSLGNMGRAYISVFTAIAAGNFVRNAVKDVQTLQASLLAASSGATEANDNFEFIKKTSMELGLPLNEAGKGYMRIAAAARAAGFETAQAREMFVGVSEATTAFGLTADDTSGVLRAFTQMLSKQQVMAEELRGQLSERMPTAMADMARAIGKTVPEMNKMMEMGELGTQEVLAMSRAMRETARASGALQAGLQTLTKVEQRAFNRMQLVAAFLGGGQLEEAYKDIIESGSKFFSDTRRFWKGIVDVISVAVRSIWAVIDGGLISPISFAMQMFGDLFDFISAVASTDVSDFKNLNFLARVLRTISGLINDVIFGWKKLSEFFSRDLAMGLQLLTGDEFAIQGSETNYPRDIRAMTEATRARLASGNKSTTINNTLDVMVNNPTSNVDVTSAIQEALENNNVGNTF